MTTSEIEALLSHLGSAGIGVIVGGFIIYMIVKSFIPSYLSEKGKNLATKEDIRTITNEIESVKSDYAEVLEEIKSENQLKLAAIEREKTIKKEVYMDAIEAITRTHNMVASFANLTLDDQSSTSPLASDAGKIAKVQVVGSKDTVKAVTRFMAAVGTATLNLMLDRSELMQRKNSIEISERFRDKASQELDRYIELMKNLNLAGNHDSDVWKTINQNIEFEQEVRDRNQSEIDDLYEKQNAEHLAFVRKCIDSSFEISELLPDAVLSVRDELELDISSEDYLDIFNSNMAVAKETLASFLERVENKMA